MQAIDCFVPPVRFRLGLGKMDKWELSDDRLSLASLFDPIPMRNGAILVPSCVPRSRIVLG
jgi:hypothetical protein